MREIKSMWATVAQPSSGDLGAVVEAFWYVEGDVLVMCSESGTATGQSERLTAGGNERAVASRLALEAWHNRAGESDFNRRLNYARLGNA
jgi:hypothetical protein